jgi:hypothetical protein
VAISGSLLTNTVTAVFAVLVPSAILFGRFAVKRQRQRFLKDLLVTLQDATGTDISLVPSFEYALQKQGLRPA